MRRSLLPLLVSLAAMLLTACAAVGSGEHATRQAGATPVAATPGSTDRDDTVALAVYFRAGEGASAHLERVTRTVPVDEDLPRRVLELLISGPEPGEGGLDQTLPVTTRVHGIEVSGGTARVVLSPEVVRDASLVGDSPANEALALAAIANTLTEFPSVERVELDVEGQGIRPEEFWGGWGLPGVLVRDEALIGPARGGEGVPELGRFSLEAQRTGSDDAPPVVVSNIRVRDRLTHVRVTIELTDPADPDTNVKVPRVRARGTHEGIVLDFSGIGGVLPDVEPSRSLTLSDPAFRELVVEPGERHSAVRVLVDGARERRFWLHSLSGPTRVVLDVKK